MLGGELCQLFGFSLYILPSDLPRILLGRTPGTLHREEDQGCQEMVCRARERGGECL